MIDKISPYSEIGVHKAIYHSIIEEWSGLSNVKSDNKTFKDLVSDIISLGMIESEYFVDAAIVKFIDTYKNERMIENKEYSTRSFETKEIEKLNTDLKKIIKENKNFDLDSFNQKVRFFIEDKYDGLEHIKPKGLNNLSEDNIEYALIKIRNTKKERLKKFKGFSYKLNGSFHFTDAISAPVVYYNKENQKEPLDSLILGISSYVLKLNEVKNTKLIIKKLNEIKNEDIKKDDQRFHFGQFSKRKKHVLRQERVASKDLDRILLRKN